ncbi:MAG: hypothetical protein QOI87_779 [Bradyrhizobium sp.]|nr:hypothetical protein [Bradyrhizobium sp.]
MLLQGGQETLDKAVPVEGLSQIANRSGPKRLCTNPLVGALALWRSGPDGAAEFLNQPVIRPAILTP